METALDTCMNNNMLCISSNTYHRIAEQLSSVERQLPLIQILQVVLQSCVRIWETVSKLIYLILLIKVEGKRHDIVLPVIRTSIVVAVFSWYPHPSKQSKIWYIEWTYNTMQWMLSSSLTPVLNWWLYHHFVMRAILNYKSICLWIGRVSSVRWITIIE